MRATRWAVVLAAVCLVVAVAAVAYAAGKAKAVPVAEVVSAKQFRLVDSEGQICAALGSVPAPDGPPALVLFDKRRAQRATLTLARDGSPMLVLADGAKHARVTLTVMADGTTALSLRGETKQSRVFLAVPAEGKAFLTLSDKRGKVIWQTP